MMGKEPKVEQTGLIPTPEHQTETGAPVDERFVKPEETPAAKRPKSGEEKPQAEEYSSTPRGKKESEEK